MGCAVKMEDMTNAYTILIKKSHAEEKRDLGMDERIIHLRETVVINVDCFHMVKNRVQWWAFMRKAMGLQVL
jgi:hypothetical protein